MVVIQQGHALGGAGLPDGADIRENLRVTGLSRAARLVQPRHRDVPAAQRLVVLDHLVDIGQQLVQRHVGGHALQPDVVQHGADLLGIPAVQAGELHPFIAQVLHLLQGAAEIGGQLVAHRKQLQGDRHILNHAVQPPDMV